MGLKLRVISISYILFILLLGSLVLDVGADSDGPQMHPIDMFLHGSPDNNTLNTSYGEYEEQHVLTTNFSDVIRTPILLGEWQTKSIMYPMTINGQLGFILYALGELQQVSFSAFLTVNDVIVSNEMSTLPQNLNESFITEFMSNPVNTTTPIELNTSDVLGFRLSLEHNDPNYYQAFPPPGQGKNVSLVFGFGMGSFVQFTANSMQITEVVGREDPEPPRNMLVTATVKCSFGVEDYNCATAKSDYGSFDLLSEIQIDNATMEIEWEWDYTVDEGGSYPVTIKVYDQNYNRWTREEDVHITTPQTEIDFSLTESDISFSKDPQMDKNTTIIAKITGSGKRWTSYQVSIEFYVGSDLIDTVKANVKRGGNNEVELLWTPDSTGKHEITVVIDPDDDFEETDENNNEAVKNVDVGEGGSKNTPGFEGAWVVFALAFCVLLIAVLGKKK